MPPNSIFYCHREEFVPAIDSLCRLCLIIYSQFYKSHIICLRFTLRARIPKQSMNCNKN